MSLSEFQGMWCIVMFDVPVRTKVQRRKYAQFRTHLLSDGFIQLQYSVYAKYFGSEKKSESTLGATVGKIPEEGYVRILKVTDHQFGKMENYFGDTLIEGEEVDEQFMLF